MTSTLEKREVSSCKKDLYRYVVNIKTGIIHNDIKPCSTCKQMKEANKKYFDMLDEAENFFEGGSKGVLCCRCFGNHRP